jgi:hypothetical protein
MREVLKAAKEASQVAFKDMKVTGNKDRRDPLDRMMASKQAAEIRGLAIICILCSPKVFEYLARRFEHSLGFREKEKFLFGDTWIVKDKRGLTMDRDFDLVCKDTIGEKMRLIDKALRKKN